MQGTGNLDSIQVIKKLGGGLRDSYLDEGMWNSMLLIDSHAAVCGVGGGVSTRRCVGGGSITIGGGGGRRLV